MKIIVSKENCTIKIFSVEELEAVADKICQRYCRFPEVYPEGNTERRG